jgi:excisionase family DNA binding protein
MEGLNALTIQPNVFYTVEETAHLLRASQPSVLKLLRSGTVRGIKVGREWRILGGELLDLGARPNDTERILVAEWFEASKRTLAEIWDNDEDAVYDQL